MIRKKNNLTGKPGKIKRAGKRLLTVLLILCLVLTTPCTGTLAETAGAVAGGSTDTETPGISGNAVTDENDDTESGEADPEAAGENSGDNDRNENGGDSGDNDRNGNDSDSWNNGDSDGNSNNEDNASILPPETETGTPANPLHRHTEKDDGSDKTTWSYVYFGAYPQSEVTDEATKQAIDSAIDQGNGQPAGTEGKSEGIDVWVGDTRYRRIRKEDCNNSKYFDDVKNSGYRYFRWQRIRWRVLKNDGSTLFVAADMAVDCKSYNTLAEVTWETCTLRQWLNDSFYRNAFSSAEQGAVMPQNVVNWDNLDYNTGGGRDTTDNVYLLSISEATNMSYGFCRNYRVGSDSRRLKTSDYANARGACRSTSSDYKDNCYWWLRSPGDGNNNAAEVGTYGNVARNGRFVYDYNAGVVPVLHINLSSDLWSMVDDGTSGGGGGSADTGKDDTGKNDTGNTQASKGKVSKISLTGISKKIAAGKKVRLEAEVFPENATDKAIIWSSSNPKYATVDADGVVNTKKTGAKKTVTITATAKDGSGIQAQYQIKLMKNAVKKVKIKASKKSVKAGSKLKLKAEVTATGKNANKKLKWTSSNEDYATVSSGGVVKTSKAGKGKTVTITAMATDGTGKKAKIKIKIQ